MSDQAQDWTTWIITTLLAGVTTMVGTIIFLAKLIESKYVKEVANLTASLIESNRLHKEEIRVVVEKHEDCLKKHHESELRFARLEAKLEVNRKQVTTNTNSIQDIEARENHGN